VPRRSAACRASARGYRHVSEGSPPHGGNASDAAGTRAQVRSMRLDSLCGSYPFSETRRPSTARGGSNFSLASRA
jgi:hypothetical protein